MDGIDYRKYYDDETYLLEEVGPAFRNSGNLDAADFYMMLIWKAERAKNHHRKRLKGIAAGSFAMAVAEIASDIWRCPERRERLEVLMKKWWFLLPTATAILTVLYPDEFTVYDWRVCDELNMAYKPWCSRGFSDALWNHYESFQRAVIETPPSDLGLRQKDRFLIGRSTRNSVENDCHRPD